ncbi:hypothetical protein PV325_001842 [Microctonus aethiopoides]|uniref:HMG box domain-containing protein n=1 Tax=Microctonus aethiopoides TaxID=144406 RepID=A0AA39EZ28_9HYME|nr:hypothetical protein PV325_001842 [Microctonus aethiopoides]KAK0158176.1 hypothetical protein PV328_009211 [Microctonus aethiopoides]
MAANDNHQQMEPRESNEPAHHARRPMNAFLIFCKRHRKSVRKHFPHLENRAVTRVLGEWWAILRPDQKISYINLAQEYKDAFLHANPDFKWYKLPAPPLRTLSTRPTNKKLECGSSYNQGMDNSNVNYESSNCIETMNPSIQPGKLADESQIGGLSSLFTPQKIESKISSENNDDETDVNITDEVIIPKPPKKRYTEVPIDLEQKRVCKSDLFGQESINNSESNNNEQHHLNEEENKTDTDGYSEENVPLDDSNYRGERSCKGLRYQKFLAEQSKNVGSTTQSTKRRRVAGLNILTGVEKHPKERRNSMSSNISEKTDSLSSEGGNSSRSDLEQFADSAEGRVEASKPEDTETEDAEGDQDYGSWSLRKRFKAEDFNLEKKIEALPSLSLEEFQEKKKQQRTKKKKTSQKLNTNSLPKRTAENQNGGELNTTNTGKSSDDIVNDYPENTDKAHLVGSQKRKARKQSITRNASATVTKNSNEEPNQPWCASPDLEALACLAEIAAKRTKLTK